MKPWLLDILACPMDKHFPLKLYIFNYETELDEFQKFLSDFEERNIIDIKNEGIIEIIEEKGMKLFKDNIVITSNPIENYLKMIVSSIEELDNVLDKSENDLSKKCLKIIKKEVKTKISEFLSHSNDNQIDNILPELYFLNKIKIDTEIESGLLFCEKCNRWYPIIETIPQMLPDDYRSEEKEKVFLSNAIEKNLLDKEFLKYDLKPFSY